MSRPILKTDSEHEIVLEEPRFAAVVRTALLALAAIDVLLIFSRALDRSGDPRPLRPHGRIRISIRSSIALGSPWSLVQNSSQFQVMAAAKWMASGVLTR